MGKWDGQFSKGEVYMTHNARKKGRIFRTIRQTQSKIYLDPTSLQSKWIAIIKKTNNKSHLGCGRKTKRSLYTLLMGI